MRMWRRLFGELRTGSRFAVYSIWMWRLEGGFGLILVSLEPPLRFGDDLGGDVKRAQGDGEGRVAYRAEILLLGEAADCSFVEDLREIDSLLVDSALDRIFAAKGEELLPAELGFVSSATEHGVFEP